MWKKTFSVLIYKTSFLTKTLFLTNLWNTLFFLPFLSYCETLSNCNLSFVVTRKTSEKEMKKCKGKYRQEWRKNRQAIYFITVHEDTIKLPAANQCSITASQRFFNTQSIDGRITPFLEQSTNLERESRK